MNHGVTVRADDCQFSKGDTPATLSDPRKRRRVMHMRVVATERPIPLLEVEATTTNFTTYSLACLKNAQDLRTPETRFAFPVYDQTLLGYALQRFYVFERLIAETPRSRAHRGYSAIRQGREPRKLAT